MAREVACSLHRLIQGCCDMPQYDPNVHCFEGVLFGPSLEYFPWRCPVRALRRPERCGRPAWGLICTGAMNPTDEQLQIASRLDAKVQRLLEEGKTDLDVFV